MAIKQFNARITMKRDTAANWEQNNPVLLNGEIIIVDTASGEVRFKVGDGTKLYKQLPFSDEAVRALISEKSGAVRYDISQNLTDEQKQQARQNIGAGTSSFDGDYNSLSNNPTIPSKTSDLTNDSGYVTEAQARAAAPVQSVDGKTGAVILDIPTITIKTWTASDII